MSKTRKKRKGVPATVPRLYKEGVGTCYNEKNCSWVTYRVSSYSKI